jgi:hypothetical protein
VDKSLLAQRPVKKYLVDALKRVGIDSYTDEASGVPLRGPRMEKERRKRDREEKKERVRRENKTDNMRGDLKRQHANRRRAGRVRARQYRAWGKQDAGQQLVDEFADGPLGSERVDGDSSVRTDDDGESRQSLQTITNMSTLATTPQVTNPMAALNDSRVATQVSTQVSMHQSQIQRSGLQSYNSALITQSTPQDRQPLLPPATTVDGLARFDEFKKLKEMMDIEAALGEAYRDQLAKAGAAKRQRENIRTLSGRP